MPKSNWEPKVGDKVKLHGYDSDGNEVDGVRGKILSIDRTVRVLIGPATHAYVFPSQLIRLVPKRRQEYWLQLDCKDFEEGSGAYTTKPEVAKLWQSMGIALKKIESR